MLATYPRSKRSLEIPLSRPYYYTVMEILYYPSYLLPDNAPSLKKPGPLSPRPHKRLSSWPKIHVSFSLILSTSFLHSLGRKHSHRCYHQNLTLSILITPHLSQTAYFCDL